MSEIFFGNSYSPMFIIFWCVMSITPLQDRPFEDYIVAQVTAEEADFSDLAPACRNQVDAKRHPRSSSHCAILVSKSRLITQSFSRRSTSPMWLTRLSARDILLKHISSKAQSQLRLGLDLKGGVGVTLMIDEAAQDGLNEFEQEEQLQDAINYVPAPRRHGCG